jgi:hypothetical protein
MPVDGFRCMFDRAVHWAGIVPADDVTLHTLRHMAISRMIAEGFRVATATRSQLS